MKKEYLLITGLVILLIITTRYACNLSRTAKQEDKAIVAADAKVTFSKDSTVAKTPVLISDKETAIRLLELQKDSLGLLLAKTLKDVSHLKTALAIATVTKIDTTTPTVITKYDTVKVNDSTKVYPEYSTSVKNKYIDYNILATHKFISLDETVKVNLIFTTSLDKPKGIKNILKSRVFTATATSKNPYVKIVNEKAFEATVKEKKWGIGFNVGMGINKSLQIQPVINFGVQYSLFYF